MRTVTKIPTRTLVNTRHTCHICIYILVINIISVVEFFLRCTITSFIKWNCFCCFSLSLGSFGNFAMIWSSNPHPKELQGARFIHLLYESPAARYFYFSFLIILKSFSAECLSPPQKVHFVWTKFAPSLSYHNLICCQDLDRQSVRMR